MLVINQLKMSPGYTMDDIYHKLANIFGVDKRDLSDVSILKESIDARKKPEIFYSLKVCFSSTKEKQILNKKTKHQVSEYVEKEFSFLLDMERKIPRNLQEKPIVVGSGPAGLFCAYFLAKNGICPLLLERGEDVDRRINTVNTFWNTNCLNEESNVQFGEGGAGTFSDGKLNTLNKDPFLRNREVLETFVKFGANPKILYEQKPHIGTDELINIVKNIRNEIIRLGGEVYFDSKVIDFQVENNEIRGVILSNGDIISSDSLVLALGHSARDTFEMLYKKGFEMEEKEFAIGLRVEHKQSLINKYQYGIEDLTETAFETASYKVTSKTSVNRGVYSFCMCPGGYVVNASSQKNHLAINGMSYSKRDSNNANSAIVINVKKEDFNEKHPLAGVRFQQELEKKAYMIGDGNIPLQLYGDFKNGKISSGFLGIEPCMKGNYQFGALHELFSTEMNKAFMEGMEFFNKIIPGFASDGVVLSGIESRTSSPLRIFRDVDLQSNIRNVYPCGEGAGYAGGITSAAADGIHVAQMIGMRFVK